MKSLALLFIITAVSFTAYSGTPISRLSQHSFGSMPDKSEVTQFVLRNKNGVTVKVISYGATITELSIPDKEGVMKNVVAGSDSLDAYLEDFPAAAIVGRFANRIANASFKIDDTICHVTQNNGKHHIHGGQKRFSMVNWEVSGQSSSDNQSSVTFTYLSKDGEEGFPGNLTTSITYSLNDRNELKLSYRATTDKPTIVNLTNHAHFNLANEGGYNAHEVWLNADHYTVADSERIPTGEVAQTKGTAFDFSIPKRIDSNLPTSGRYDDNFVINDNGEYKRTMRLAARVSDPKSGRVMEVRTDQPGIQFYTGNRAGFCLESQGFPDGINQPNFPSPIVRPDSPFESDTVFIFSVQ